MARWNDDITDDQMKGTLESQTTQPICELTGEGFSKLIERFEDSVYSLVFYLLGDCELAERATVDTFVKLAEAQDTLSDEPLDKIVHRFAYDAALPLLLELIDERAEAVASIGEEVNSEEAKRVYH
ncbi:MAG: sigma-70 family RNA polymerase sigma factor [Bdellovibrionales bacterium]|nr:sigma-70 family RNA polymerase sigma factor [Bdellovibrionales bacterium]